MFFFFGGGGRGLILRICKTSDCRGVHTICLNKLVLFVARSVVDRSGSVRVLGFTVCRGVTNRAYGSVSLPAEIWVPIFGWYILFVLPTANFGYNVYYIPFNFGYIGEKFGYIGTPRPPPPPPTHLQWVTLIIYECQMLLEV